MIIDSATKEVNSPGGIPATVTRAMSQTGADTRSRGSTNDAAALAGFTSLRIAYARLQSTPHTRIRGQANTETTPAAVARPPLSVSVIVTVLMASLFCKVPLVMLYALEPLPYVFTLPYALLSALAVTLNAALPIVNAVALPAACPKV